MNKKKIQKPDSIPFSECEMEAFARILLPIIREIALSEEGQKDYAEWQKQQLNNKNINNENCNVSDCSQKD